MLQTRLENLGTGSRRASRGRRRFTEGLVTAFLIFCIGPMTLLGSLSDGLSADHTLLFTKSTLDGFMSIALASTYGIGVLFSIVPLFLSRAGSRLSAGWLARLRQRDGQPADERRRSADPGTRLNLLDVAKLRITNLLPALVVMAALVMLLRIAGLA